MTRSRDAHSNRYIEAFRQHKLASLEAYEAFVVLCNGRAPPRVPGMDTVIRLAWRIKHGNSVEEAAAHEYLYRWKLAIKAPDQCGATGKRSYDPRDRMPRSCVSVFGVPHPIGM
jgi:hypothetical protein